MRYGPQSADEMAELWFQLLPRNRADLDILAQGYSVKMRQTFADHAEYLLRLDPENVKAHTELAVTRLAQGQIEEAQRHLRSAIRIDRSDDQPHYYLGLIFRQQRKLDEARSEFETALRLNPDNAKAHGNLGVIFAEQGNAELAEAHLRDALRINPDDALARECLNELLKTKSTPPKKSL